MKTKRYVLSLILIIGLAMPCFGGSVTDRSCIAVESTQAIMAVEIKPIHCSRCGKSMTDEHGSSIIGVQITVRTEDGVMDMTKDHTKEQLGKYELNKEYSFCYECWLDSLMGIK